MAHAVLTFVEQRGGEIKRASLEALGASRGLADALGGTLAAVIAGSGIGEASGSLGAYGVDQVYAADDPILELYSTEGYAAAVSAAAAKAEPRLLVFSGTAMGKDLAPRIAARLERTLMPDLVAAAVEDGALAISRPQYAGKATWKLKAPAGNAVLSLRPNVFPVPSPGGNDAPVEPVDLGGVAPRAKTVALKAAEKGIIDVSEADIVVSGGRGLKEPGNFSLVFDLARELGAAVGASRAVVDAGWIDHEHQVGQTGKTVSPTLYIAAGISGAIQHLAGMRTSKRIVAINKDAEAPIFQAADYGLVGDALEILPRLTEAVREAKSRS